jgi:predicted P-loop ATPase
MPAPEYALTNPSPDADPKHVAWLRSLSWDGQDRLSSYLSVCLGADGSPRTRLVGRRLLIGAVARMVAPACRIDALPVLVGPVGAGKTRFIRDIGAAVPARDDGSFLPPIVEADEFRDTDLKGVAWERALALRLAHTDVYRAPFGRDVKVTPRAFVYVGTTTEGTERLKDSRRVLLVEVRRYDDKRLLEWRDQLWAQAATAYSTGETWLNPEGL